MSSTDVRRRRWSILAILLVSLFAVTLDNTVLNVALPTLVRELGATPGQLQWIVDAYILVFAGLLLVAGAFSDRYGRRLLLVLGLATFGIGSLGSLLVSSPGHLIVLRAFLGLGAAMIMPSTLSIIGQVFEPHERPKALAIWSAVSGIGIVAGPVVGGALLEHLPWASVFLINVPFVVIGIVASLKLVPESRSSKRVPFDPLGALLSIGGLAALVFGVIESPVHGWASPTVLGTLSAAAVLLGLFVWWEQRQVHPMLDVRLFANPRFSAASVSIALVFFSLTGALFFLTQYLQGVLGLSPFDAGLRFIPLAAGLLVVAPLSARLIPRLGARVLTSAGLLAVAAGLGLVATLGVDSGTLQVGGVFLAIAVGAALASTPATDSIMGALPPSSYGVGSAVNDTTREVGGALGVATLGSVFTATYRSAMEATGTGLPETVRESLLAAADVAGQLGGVAGDTLLHEARIAFVAAMVPTTLIGAGVALVGAAVAFLFMPRKAAAAQDALSSAPRRSREWRPGDAHRLTTAPSVAGKRARLTGEP
jgi:EmrB/QacA subfamily drug resistance transporter